MLEKNNSGWLDQNDEVIETNWFDGFRWMPREFRDWFANDGLRLEEVNDENGLTVRAEVPGVDPTVDVDVRVVDGHLAIEVRKRESKEAGSNGHRRSEFRYGDFYRRLPLPEGTKTEEISATYDKGVLNVSIPVEKRNESQVKVVPVESISG